MAVRFLTRHVPTHVNSSHLLPAIGCSVSLHTAVCCLDSSDPSRSSSSDAAPQKPAPPAEVRNFRPGREREHQQAANKGELRQSSPRRASRQQTGQQRQLGDQDPRSGPQRTSWYQPRGQPGGLQRATTEGGSRQSWRTSPNRSDEQHQRPGPLSQRQGSGHPRGTPSRSGSDQGPLPAFIDRSSPNRGPRPSSIDRSGSSNQAAMADQRQRSARQAPPRQQGRPIPGNAPLDEPDPDDPNQQAYNDTKSKRARSQLAARRVTPGPARTERAAPGANLRGGGPAKGIHLTAPPYGFDVDTANGVDAVEDESVSEDYLERIEHNPRGVPASWREEIQDPEDQEDLDEARKISAFNRRRISGDVKMLEDELMNDMHALEMNSDPKLDFELDTPVMEELDEPDANDILDKYKEELCNMMGIGSDEDWKEITDGLPEEFADLHQELRGGLSKPRVQEWSLETFVKQSMPSSHPMYPTVSQSLQMLQSNPSFNQKQRFTFMRRLIKDLN